MTIEQEKRSDFEARVKEALHLYSYRIQPEFYENEDIINELAVLVGWDKQSPIEKQDNGDVAK